MTTFCTKSDIESILSAALVARAVDDDEDGGVSAEEDAAIDAAIRRAAGTIHAYLGSRYDLASLADNVFLRDANAMLAAQALTSRRGNAAPAGVQQQAEVIETRLVEMQAGRQRLPGAVESHDQSPQAVNFDVDLGRDDKIRAV